MLTRAECLAVYGERGFAERLRAGAVRRLFRGIYVDGATPVDDRLRVEGALAACPGLVAVRESAAVLHGFGVLRSDVVHLAGSLDTTARGQPGLRLHGLRLARNDVELLGGRLTTTAERTVFDLTRSVPPIDGLAVVDAALRIGACTPESLAEQLLLHRGQRGVVRARYVCAFGDPAAESPMESRTRMRILATGLPPPVLQWEVRIGGVTYRLDLAWPDRRVAVEYDGADHLEKDRQRTDLARRSALIHAGWRILWVTDTDIYRHHQRFTRRLADLLLR